jgi:hypothetical protein
MLRSPYQKILVNKIDGQTLMAKHPMPSVMFTPKYNIGKIPATIGIPINIKGQSLKPMYCLLSFQCFPIVQRNESFYKFPHRFIQRLRLKIDIVQKDWEKSGLIYGFHFSTRRIVVLKKYIFLISYVTNIQ